MTTTDIRFFRVGGCVRDELLGSPSKDIDFAVEAPSFEAMADAVNARCSRVFQTVPEFFTIRGLDPHIGAVDFVLCRKDGPSSDGRRPDFVEPGTIWDDLARRDFTVNAMAMSEDGRFFDPHLGEADLRRKVLRFVGNPAERLAEDALRAFRALRFAVTKGFRIPSDTSDALRGMRSEDFASVSTERIRDELLRCFAHDTFATLFILQGRRVGPLLDVALERGVWLKPTMEKP